MSLDPKLLDVLCCPVSKVPVRPLSTDRLESLNNAIGERAVQYVDGKPVLEALQQGLITDDHKVIYRVDDGIPVMLAELGIGTTQLNGKVAGF